MAVPEQRGFGVSTGEDPLLNSQWEPERVRGAEGGVRGKREALCVYAEGWR